MSEHPVQDFFHQAQEQLHQAQKQIKQSSVLGVPLDFHGKTLIPVAARPSWLERCKRGKRAVGKPLGFLELGEGKTRFVRIQDNRRLLLAVAMAVLALLFFIAGLGAAKKRARRRRPSLW